MSRKCYFVFHKSLFKSGGIPSVISLSLSRFQRVAIEKARSYLLAHLDAQQNPYAIAITVYALSLNRHQVPDAMRAHRKLMDLATCDNSYGSGSAFVPDLIGIRSIVPELHLPCLYSLRALLLGRQRESREFG